MKVARRVAKSDKLSVHWWDASMVASRVEQTDKTWVGAMVDKMDVTTAARSVASLDVT